MTVKRDRKSDDDVPEEAAAAAATEAELVGEGEGGEDEEEEEEVETPDSGLGRRRKRCDSIRSSSSSCGRVRKDSMGHLNDLIMQDIVSPPGFK